MHKITHLKRPNLNLTIPLTKNIQVHILFFIVLAASFLGKYHIYFISAYVSALMHELAHILCAGSLKVKISKLKIQPFGICAELSSYQIEYPHKEVLIAFSGPLCSALIALALYYAQQYLPFLSGELCTYAVQINLMLALINLIPALPLDGGRVLKAALTKVFGCVKAYNIALKVSRMFIITLLAGAVYLLLSTQFNFSLLLIGVFLLGNLASEQKNLTLTAMKELIEHKERFFRSETHKAKCITVLEDIPARKILSHFRSSDYYIVHAINHSAQITATLTETQIIDALLNQGIRILIKDIK